MRKIKGLELIGKVCILLERMKEVKTEQDLNKHVGAFKRLLAEVQRYNRKLKDERYLPAFKQVELGIVKFIEVLEDKGRDEVLKEAIDHIKDASKMMGRGEGK